MSRRDQTIAANVKALRESSGMSQTALSNRMHELAYGCTQMTIARTENATRKLTLDQACGLAQIFGVTLDELVGESSTPTSSLRAGLLEARNLIDNQIAQLGTIR